MGQLLELVRMTAFEECIGTLLKIDAFGTHALSLNAPEGKAIPVCFRFNYSVTPNSVSETPLFSTPMKPTL